MADPDETSLVADVDYAEDDANEADDVADAESAHFAAMRLHLERAAARGKTSMQNVVEQLAASAPPQAEWIEYFTEGGRPYYYNETSGESRWQCPVPEQMGLELDLETQLQGAGLYGGADDYTIRSVEDEEDDKDEDDASYLRTGRDGDGRIAIGIEHFRRIRIRIRISW